MLLYSDLPGPGRWSTSSASYLAMIPVPVTVLSLYEAISIDILTLYLFSLSNLPDVVLRSNYQTVTFLSNRKLLMIS